MTYDAPAAACNMESQEKNFLIGTTRDVAAALLLVPCKEAMSRASQRTKSITL